jgi:DNA invertase Pin-like site-specific DNA recombinase
MDVIGYIRVSSDKQDLQKQEHYFCRSRCRQPALGRPA